MAGHSKFKNIQHRKGAQDQKKAKLFTRLTKEINIAIKSGSPDPALNPKLRSVMINARALNLPKDRINKIIQQASAASDQHNYHEVRYEGYAAGSIAIIAESLTDNRNRTAAEVRSIFGKCAGNLGETNSVSFLFDYLGFIHYDLATINFDEDRMLELASELDVEDVEFLEDEVVIYTNPNNFSQVLDEINNTIGTPNNAYLGWHPKNYTQITDLETGQKIIKLIEMLEENDDVQQVFSNHRLSQDLISHLIE